MSNAGNFASQLAQFRLVPGFRGSLVRSITFRLGEPTVTVRSILTPVFGLVLFLMAATLTAADPSELKLWPGGVPGETEKPGETKVQPGNDDIIRVTYVGDPTMTIFRAPAETANGCAVVICPGGRYSILAWDLEGTEIAEWLNSIGVTGIVLKYRVPRRDKEQPHKAPLQDARRAIRLARKNADAWAIDPQRVGILGFSAGGNLAVMAGTHWDKATYEKVDDADQLSCRPDFMVPIYAAYLGAKDDPWAINPLVRVTEETPPTFMPTTTGPSSRRKCWHTKASITSFMRRAGTTSGITAATASSAAHTAT